MGYGNCKKTQNGNYALTISLGYNAEGKRIRKYRTVEANSDEHAKYLLLQFYLEYKNIKVRNKKTEIERMKLKEKLKEFCKITCNKEICKESNCKAYKFYIFHYNKILEEYEYKNDYSRCDK